MLKGHSRTLGLLGVPQIALSKGPADVVFNADGPVSGHLGTATREICAELGGS